MFEVSKLVKCCPSLAKTEITPLNVLTLYNYTYNIVSIYYLYTYNYTCLLLQTEIWSLCPSINIIFISQNVN